MLTRAFPQPFLTTVKEVSFPLTQYGEHSERYVTLSNPSDAPVIIDGAAFYTVFDGDADAGGKLHTLSAMLLNTTCELHLLMLLNTPYFARLHLLMPLKAASKLTSYYRHAFSLFSLGFC